jgi:hypothetical protein
MRLKGPKSNQSAIKATVNGYLRDAIRDIDLALVRMRGEDLGHALQAKRQERPLGALFLGNSPISATARLGCAKRKSPSPLNYRIADPAHVEVYLTQPPNNLRHRDAGLFVSGATQC